MTENADLLDREWNSNYPDEEGGRYFIKYSFIWNGTELKLYDAESRELLARRKYNSNGFIKFSWSENSLVYNTAADTFLDEGFVNLPPTRWDWVSARLPW